MNKIFVLTLCLTAGAFVTACDTKEDKIREAISAKIAQTICQRAPLNRTRLREDEWGSIVQSWLDNGYIAEVESDQDFSLWKQRLVEPKYAFTDKGRTLIKDGDFRQEICLGQRDIGKIVNISAPYSDARGRTYLDVEATYVDTVTADWARDIESIENRFHKKGTRTFRFVQMDDDTWALDTEL
mgnify:CR=1 FL=1